MIWFFYNIIFSIVYVILLPRYLIRMIRRGGYKKGFLQRAGFYGQSLKDRLRMRPRIWIHAVSVGEVFIALRFMEELHALRNETAFVLTTTTSTGHAVAKARMRADDILLYFPADFPIVVRHVLNTITPLALIIVECELWPNLIRHARKKNIPVILLNGRLSRRSYRGYKMVRPFVKRTLACFNLICAQSKEDAQSLIELGADTNCVKITGSAKYDILDITPKENENSIGALKAFFSSKARLLVAGSTWSGEERVLLKIYKKLHAIDSNARLVLVPRHVERTHKVLKEIESAGLSAVLWSTANKNSLSPDSDVLLVNTTGELNFFYAMANVIFVGKSLTHRGGQNVIEPASYGKPIVVGPYTENFTSIIADFLSDKALIQVTDKAGLEQAIISLWNDEKKQQALGNQAKAVVQKKAGAIHRSVHLYISLIDQGEKRM